MATRVLDSWALLAFFEDEPAAEEVETLLARADAGRDKLLLCVVNWGEVYYNIMRKISAETAEQKALEISGLSIEIIPVDSKNLDLTRQAAIYKATKRMSYADCFAAALAKIRKAQLMTGNPEFKQVENEIRIGWLK